MKKISKILLSLFMVMTLCMNTTMNVKALSIITDIDASGVIIPYAGDSGAVDTSNVRLDTSNVDVVEVKYYHLTDDPTLVQPSDTFVEGDTYELWVVVKAKENFEFPDNSSDLTTTVNGLPSTKGYQSNSKINLYYKFKATKAFEITTIPDVEEGIEGVRSYVNLSQYVSGGMEPYTYQLNANTNGLALINKETGNAVITRNPKTTRATQATLTVTDAYGRETQRSFNIGVVSRPEGFAQYDTTVGGQRVTTTNKDDVLQDGGSVVYTPASGSNPAKLTLTNATINEGCVYNTPDTYHACANIITEENLEISVFGDNATYINDVAYSSYYEGNDVSPYSIVSTDNLSITGDGTLSAPSGIYLEGGSLTQYSGSIDITLSDAGAGDGYVYYGGQAKVRAFYEEEFFNFTNVNNPTNADVYLQTAPMSNPTGSDLTYMSFEDFEAYDEGFQRALNYFEVKQKEEVYANVYVTSTEPGKTTNEISVKFYLNPSEISYFASYAAYTEGYIVDNGTYSANTESFVEGKTYSISDGTTDSILNTFIYPRLSVKYKISPERVYIWNGEESQQLSTMNGKEDIFNFSADIKYTDILVGGKKVVSSNKNDILGDGSISYDETTNTFTIHKDINYEGSVPLFAGDYESSNTTNIVVEDTCNSINLKYMLIANENWNVDIKGDLTIETNSGSSVFSANDLNMVCAGNLKFINNYNGWGPFTNSYGVMSIYAKGNIDVESKGRWFTSSNNVTERNRIKADGNITVTGNSNYAPIQDTDIIAKGNVTLDYVGSGQIITDGGSIDAGGAIKINSENSVSGPSHIETMFVGDCALTAKGDITIDTNNAYFYGDNKTMTGKNIKIVDTYEYAVVYGDTFEVKADSLSIVNTEPSTDPNEDGNPKARAISSATTIKFTSTRNGVSVQTGDTLDTLENVLVEHTSSLDYVTIAKALTISSSEIIEDYGFNVSKTSFTYNGKEQQPIVTAEGLTEGTDYTVTYPTNAVSVGTYTVTITGKGNYAGTKTLTYTIDKATISNTALTLSKNAYTYDGKAKKPSVSIEGLVEGTDFTVSYQDDVINAGTKTITITGTGNYTGTVTAEYTINKASYTPTSKAYSGAYDAKAHTITLSNVKAGSTIKYRTSTTGTWSTTKPKRTAVGMTTVYYKITNKNYKDVTGSKTITIKPKKAVISSTSVGANKVTVKMSTKVSATGGSTYQIQYRVKGTTTWKNTTTTTQSKIISSLKKGKKYQVRVRAKKTVSGKTYYGAWSTIKTTAAVK